MKTADNVLIKVIVPREIEKKLRGTDIKQILIDYAEGRLIEKPDENPCDTCTSECTVECRMNQYD